MLGAQVVLCVTAAFFENNIFALKMEALSQKWAENKIFWINGKFSNYFFQNLVHNEKLYYKNPVPEIWTKMLEASQIEGFLNQLYL